MHPVHRSIVLVVWIVGMPPLCLAVGIVIGAWVF